MHAQVSFKAAASAAAGSGTLSFTINKPTATTSGDVMIAAIGVRPNTATITAPSGWTLIRRKNQSSSTANSQAIYRKTAGASEPANYTWSFNTSTGSAGGIMTFSGVDATVPINVENGRATASGLTHATPSVTTTVNGAMLVTAHSFASSATWTPPTGMTEAVDVASNAAPNSGGLSIEMNYVLQPTAGATGTKTATASANADAGVAQIVAMRATTKTWDGGAGTNNWGDAANWNPDGVPTSSSDVSLTGANTININLAASAKNFTLNNASLTLTILSGNSLTVSGNLTLTAGTLNTQASFPSVTGTVSVTGGTVGYTAASGSQTIAVQSYNNLTISGGGTKTLAGNISPTANLTIAGGVFDLGTFIANRASAGGTLTVSNGATLRIGGTRTLPS
ncbi:MAG: hypothetical protein AAB393_17620, partial [Bacteroidota bacterium]